ncbi:MAG: hypothetical protein AAF662_13560 [Pseudomonadota bacterium]
MARTFSLIVAWGCTVVLAAGLCAALYFSIDIESFADLATDNLDLRIQWSTVGLAQWYGLWFLTCAHLGLGLGGVFFLRRAFSKFARGEFFTESNSRDLRLFSALLFAQAFAKPLQHALSSVLLSWNHADGQKLLSISLGSDELKIAMLAMILWVISDMLVRGRELEHENQQFV